MSALRPRPPRQAAKVQSKATSGVPRVWVLQDGQPAAVEVTTGATNGRLTEITAGDLKAGMLVITEASGVQP